MLYPDLLYRLNAQGDPQFPDFAAKVRPTEFAPGVMKGTGSMTAADWMVRWAEGLEPTPRGLTLRAAVGGGQADAQSRTFRFHIPQYLMRRSKDWADRGFTETLIDWRSLNARSKFWGDDQRAAFKNWEEIDNLYNRQISYPLGPNAGITEILIPAGYVKVAYDPSFELATDARGRKYYRSRTSTAPIEAPAPGIPFSINFLVEPGMEPVALKAATAYESASRRRVSPPSFPALAGEP